MQERVQCAECGSSYDSTRHPFCPRCGSLKAGEPAAARPRFDVSRRRVHMAGIVLVLMGLAAVIPMGIVLMDPPPVDGGSLTSLSESQFVRAGRGGTLAVDVVHDGAPTNVEARVHAWNGTLSQVVQVNGSASIQMPGPFANVTFHQGQETWTRHVYAPEGKTARARIDLADASTGPEWVSMDLTPLVRITSAVGLVAGLVVVGGGVAALRLRWFPLAVTGAALAFGGSLLLAFAAFVLALNVLLSLIALVLVVRGRASFSRS